MWFKLNASGHPRFQLPGFSSFSSRFSLRERFITSLEGRFPTLSRFDGPVGAAFEGRYAAVEDTASGLPENAETFRGVYPQTVTIWEPALAGRRRGVTS